MSVLTKDEKKTLSVLAFLLFRMGFDQRAERVYEAIAEMSDPQSSDYRYAQTGLAAVEIEIGNGEKALAAVRKAKKGGPLSSREASLWMLEAQALWLQGRKEEAAVARDQYLYLTGSKKVST